MARKFVPTEDRQFLKDDLLPTMPPFTPGERPAYLVPIYIKARLGSLAQCYWFGLADEARPRLVEIVQWMENSAPPDPHGWPRGQPHYRAVENAHFMWWQSLGLSRWLLSADPAIPEFARAVHIELAGWERATPAEAAQDHRDRQDYLGERLATCLTANSPTLGIRFYEAARIRAPFNLGRPALEFGRWASAYLAEGHLRDATFVAKGEGMFRATFLPFFQPSSFWLEATLWLKAIYFDSGTTRTAEETIFRAYDCMPGIPRPDFLPG